VVVVSADELLLVIVPVPSGGFIAFSKLSVPVVDDVLVFRILGSYNSFRFSGYHPRSQIAFLLVDFLANGFGHTRFISGIASHLAMLVSIPIRVLYSTSFPFSRVISVFHGPLCSEESPTCHFPVPLGRPMQIFHLCPSSLRVLEVNCHVHKKAAIESVRPVRGHINQEYPGVRKPLAEFWR
jgi:hypothetical protein